MGKLVEGNVGEALGLLVGVRDGLHEGLEDGDIVGLNEGRNVGFKVDGASVGVNEGELVGGRSTKLGDSDKALFEVQITHTFTVPVDGITMFVVSVLPLLVG